MHGFELSLTPDERMLLDIMVDAFKVRIAALPANETTGPMLSGIETIRQKLRDATDGKIYVDDRYEGRLLWNIIQHYLPQHLSEQQKSTIESLYLRVFELVRDTFYRS